MFVSQGEIWVAFMWVKVLFKVYIKTHTYNSNN